MNGLNVLIYGIDRYTEFVISSVRKENNIIGVSDSVSDISYFGRFRFIKDIDKIEFDYIILSARNRGVRDELLNTLINKGIPPQKIVSFFEIFHEPKLKKILNKNPLCEYDGVVIGLSHSAYGINPKYLEGKWVNLAVSSEDLFYHKEVLMTCFSLYKRNFIKTKYIIIDLYDYNYFSVDTSRGRFALPYWIYGGMPKRHNYLHNQIYKNDIEKEMSERFRKIPAYYSERTENELVLRGIIFDERKVFDNIGKYFVDIGPMNCGYDDFPNEFSSCGHIAKIPNISAGALLRTLSNDERYEETERENIKIFNDIIALIKTELPDAKIVFTLIPRYEMIEEIHAENIWMLTQKKKFLKNLEGFIDNKSIFFMDLKSNKETKSITNNYYLWRDEQHLNYQGSIALTSIYDKFLNKI